MGCFDRLLSIYDGGYDRTDNVSLCVFKTSVGSRVFAESLAQLTHSVSENELLNDMLKECGRFKGPSQREAQT